MGFVYGESCRRLGEEPARLAPRVRDGFLLRWQGAAGDARRWWRGAPRHEESSHLRNTGGVALRVALTPERESRVLTGIPTLLSVGDVGLNGALMLPRQMLGKTGCTAIAIDGRTGNTSFLRNLPRRHALLPQCAYLLKARQAHRPPFVPASTVSGRPFGRSPWRIRPLERACCFLKAAVLTRQEALDDFACVEQQGKAVSDLPTCAACGAPKRAAAA